MTAPELTPEMETLVALVLPWAKDRHPGKYAETVKVIGKPSVFRAYLLRLVELRWEEDKGWRREVPFDILDETAITARFKRGDYSFEVKGKRAAMPRVWTFEELKGIDEESFSLLRAAKETLDLVHVEKPWTPDTKLVLPEPIYLFGDKS